MIFLIKFRFVDLFCSMLSRNLMKYKNSHGRAKLICLLTVL